MTARRISAGVQSTGPSTQGRRTAVRSPAAACVEDEGRVGVLLQEAGGDRRRSCRLRRARCTIGALCSPKAMMTILRASRMVPTPIVRAWCGTFSSPKKSLAASRRVTGSSVTRRVRLWRVEPGSLKPMWPVRPMPRICRSMPPARRIICS